MHTGTPPLYAAVVEEVGPLLAWTGSHEVVVEEVHNVDQGSTVLDLRPEDWDNHYFNRSSRFLAEPKVPAPRRKV